MIRTKELKYFWIALVFLYPNLTYSAIAADGCSKLNTYIEQKQIEKAETYLNETEIDRSCGFYLLDFYYRNNNLKKARHWYNKLKFKYDPNDKTYDLYLYYTILFSEKSDKLTENEKKLLERNPALAAELNLSRKIEKKHVTKSSDVTKKEENLEKKAEKKSDLLITAYRNKLEKDFSDEYSKLYNRVINYYKKNEFDKIMSSQELQNINGKYLKRLRDLASPGSLQKQNKTQKKIYKKVTTDKSLKEGKQFFYKNQIYLINAYKKTGVEPSDIISIINWESRLGKYTGKYLVIKSLVGQYFFIEEVEEELFREGAYRKKNIISRETALRRIKRLKNRALKNLSQLMIQAKDRGFDIFSVKGSWAGAIGIPQFMPASMKYARDGNNDQVIDLNTMPDAIMSVAIYLVNHGYHQEGKLYAFKQYNRNDEYVRGVDYYSNRIQEMGVLP